MAQNFVQTQSLPVASVTDGVWSGMLAGKMADAIVSELHGKFYTAAYRAKMFYGSTVITGQTLNTQSTTTLTFGLFNPVVTPTVAEPVSYYLGPNATAFVSGTIYAKFSNQTPTSTTAITATVISTNVSKSGTASGYNAQVLSAGTITAVTSFLPIMSVNSTTINGALTYGYDFDGRFVLPSGALLDFGANPAQTNTMFQAILWAEWPT